MYSRYVRLNRLSEIFAGIGHISLASVVIPALLDRFNPTMIAWGLVISLTFWALSILLARSSK